MKKKILTTILVCSFAILFANDKYEQTMLTTIQSVYSAQTPEEFLKATNSFERIGNAEKNKWEPFYYASFGYIMLATREVDGTKKDGLLDKATEVLKKASAINSGESEIITLEGFIYMMRVTVDPATRGQQFAGLAMQTYNKALSINPENPRAMAMLAQMEFGTAQFFKSSTAEACATATKSLEKFETFKSDNPLAPVWGKETANRMLAMCK